MTPEREVEIRGWVAAFAADRRPGRWFPPEVSYQEARQWLAEAVPELLDEIERLRGRPPIPSP